MKPVRAFGQLTGAIFCLAILICTNQIFSPVLRAADTDKKTAEAPAAEQKQIASQTPEARAAALFEKLDANHDGQISADEVPEAQRRLFQRLLRVHDKNNDGKLTREEFIAGMADYPPSEAERAQPQGAADDQARIEVYPIKTADPNLVLKVLKTMLADSPDVKLAIDEKAKNLVALARPKDHEAIRGIVAKMEKNPSADLSTLKPISPAAMQNSPIENMKGAESEIAQQQESMRAATGRAAGGRAAEGNGGRGPNGRGGQGRGPLEGVPGAAGGPYMGIAIFHALDTNGDGKLDATEIAAASEVLKKLANSSGDIAREELLQSMPGLAAAANGGGPGGRGGARGTAEFAAESPMKRMLDQLEKNGKLQKSDLPPRFQSRFEELDTNHDGFLDESEVKPILPRAQGQLNGPPGVGPPNGQRPRRPALDTPAKPDAKPAEAMPADAK